MLNTSLTRQENRVVLPNIRKMVKVKHRCPICNKLLSIGIEQSVLNNIERFPYAHIVLHGSPLHAVIAYIDANLQVRGLEASNSIEIKQNSETFSEILKKWSNPF